MKKKVLLERDDRIQLENEQLDHIMDRLLPLMKEFAHINEKINKVDEDLANTLIRISTAFVVIGIPALLTSFSLNTTTFNKRGLIIALLVMSVLGLLGIIGGFKKKYALKDKLLGDYVDELKQISHFIAIASSFPANRLRELEEALKKAGVNTSKAGSRKK